MKSTIQKGDIVRSIKNKIELYRVQKIGPKRAVLVLHNSAGYYRFYCAPALLRKVKVNPPPRQAPDLMERTRGAVCLLNSAQSGSDGEKLAAFLELFHPGMPEDTKRNLVRDARERPSLRTF